MALYISHRISAHKRKFLLIFLFSLFYFQSLRAQSLDEWVTRLQPFPEVRVYVHTDRDFYFLKDMIWFKAYIAFSTNRELTSGNENVFVDLVDQEGKSLLKKNLIASNGMAAGYIYLPDSLKPGNYILRAYTSYLNQFGEDAIYHKQIRILTVTNSAELPANDLHGRQRPEVDLLPDVAILPEGGFLLEKTFNHAAVRAVGPDGKGLATKGIIRDEKGDSVTFFETGFNGMGHFYIYPLEGKSYFATLPDYPGFRKVVPVSRDGVKIQVLRQDTVHLVINVMVNSQIQSGRSFVIASVFQGQVQFYKQFKAAAESQLLKLPKKMFPGGINRIILLDQQLNPVSERLIFSDNYQVNSIDIQVDTNFYSTRSAINLRMQDSNREIHEEISLLSVSVIDENSVNVNGPSQNILSGLLLGQELKGVIESPAWFFVNDSIPSEKKLDLLMLTHGWVNYAAHFRDIGDPPPVYRQEIGISLQGWAKRLLAKKPLVNGEIIAMLFKQKDPELLLGITDEKGRFRFDDIFITDTVMTFLQVRNEKGKPYAEVFLDPVFEEPDRMSDMRTKALRNYADIPISLYRSKYFSDLALREFYPDTSSILLGEVEVKRELKEKDDGHFRIYGSTNNSIKIPDNAIGYSDILTFLAGRVAGLMVSGSSVSIRGMATPNVLIDGMMYEGEAGIDMLRSIPVSDIDVVDVLKDVSDLAVFGVRGGNGIIAIYTKRGEMNFQNTYTPGVIREKIVGYQPYKEFYSPQYSPENIDRPEPDYRTTLYWNPYVLTTEGQTSLTFFSCDQVTGYKIFVEGVTNKGRICIGTGQFIVDRLR